MKNYAKPIFIMFFFCGLHNFRNVTVGERILSRASLNSVKLVLWPTPALTPVILIQVGRFSSFLSSPLINPKIPFVAKSVSMVWKVINRILSELMTGEGYTAAAGAVTSSIATNGTVELTVKLPRRWKVSKLPLINVIAVYFNVSDRHWDNSTKLFESNRRCNS